MSINVEVDNNHKETNKINDMVILSSIFGTKKITEKLIFSIKKKEKRNKKCTFVVWKCNYLKISTPKIYLKG